MDVMEEMLQKANNFLEYATSVNSSAAAMQELKKELVTDIDIGLDPRSPKGKQAIEKIAKKYASNFSDKGLYESTITTVLSAEQCSVSLLQRRLRKDYVTSAALVDQMEADGLVGPADGVNPRKILIKLTEA